MKRAAELMCALSLFACADGADGPSEPDPTPTPEPGTAREFSLRIENVAPWTMLKGSAQRTKVGGGDGNLAPGEAYEVRFTAGAGHHVSFATMLFESNDWFFAPEPAGIPLYTNGAPTSGDVTSYVRLWDAGTEADQLPGVGAHTGALQASRDAGAADPTRRVRLVPATVAVEGGTFTRPRVEAMIRVTLTPGIDRQFTLRIENVSTTATLAIPGGTRAITLAPMLWAVHRRPAPLFADGAEPRGNGFEQLVEAGQVDAMNTALRLERGVAASLSRGVALVHRDAAPLFAVDVGDRGAGLEALVEDGDEAVLLASLDGGGGGTAPAALATPVGASSPGPAAPGEAYEVTVVAAPGDRLSFATQFGAANDWFFAGPADGIALFQDGLPRWGDVTSEVRLYDLGTELDEELDVGVNTAPHQPAPNTGRPDRVMTVREVGLDRYETPVARHLRVTLTPGPALAE